MKGILTMAGVGVGLFCATVVGLLGLQGRLDHEGTRGVPVLSLLFSAPAEEEHATTEQGPGQESDAAHAGDSPEEPFGVQHDGLGKEELLPYEIGPSAFEDQGPPAEAQGGGHGAAGDAEANADDPHAPPAGTDAAPLVPPEDEFDHQMEALLGQDRYRRGHFFKFPRLEGDITVEELNRYLRASKLALDEVENKRAQLEAYEAELAARQRDVEDRERLVAEQMTRVDTERAKLDRRIKEFESQVLLVQRDELPALREYARTLASFEPRRAMEHVVQSWETEDGRDRILKVMSVMDSEAADAILNEVELPKLREILLQRLRVVTEQEAR